MREAAGGARGALCPPSAGGHTLLSAGTAGQKELPRRFLYCVDRVPKVKRVTPERGE